MSLTKKLFNYLTAAVVALASVPFAAGNAFAAEGDNNQSEALPSVQSDAPATSKRLIPNLDEDGNEDGTYTLALSVTGDTSSSSTTEVSKANVILAIDTSNSMNQNSGTAGVSRIQAEKAALTKDNGIIDNLLKQNVPGDAIKSDIIEVGLVNFGNSGQKSLDPTTNSTLLKSTINGLTTSTGTNWEEGLKQARAMADSLKTAQPNEDIYIIFLTDGEPTTHEGGPTNHEGNYTVSTNYATEWGYANDDARGIVEAGYKFYALFTWGSGNSSHYLSSLVQYAYTGAGNSNTSLSADYAQYFTDASDTTTLISALTQIVNDITTGVGYIGVELTDGVTEMTDSNVRTSIGGEITGLKYYRSGGSYSETANNGLGEEWADAPHATVNANGELDWSLGANLVLEKGVTYTVAFTVWPKQESLDLVAALNNGDVEYDSLSSEEKGQVIKSGEAYTLKTNTDFPSVKYSIVTTKTVNGVTSTTVSEPKTSGITNPEPVALSSAQLGVKKCWNDGLSYQRDDFELDTESGKHYVDLDVYRKDAVANTKLKSFRVYEGEGDCWTTAETIDVAPGIMVTNSELADAARKAYSFEGKTYYVLEDGHDYYVDEPILATTTQENTLHYELTKYEYHPMLINNKLMNVVFSEDGQEIEALEDLTEDASLRAENSVKGGIEVRKQVYRNGKSANNLDVETNDTFDLTLTIKNADGTTYSYKNADGSDTTYYRIYTCGSVAELDDANATCERSGKTYISDGIVEINDLGVKQKVIVSDVKAGATYEIVENTSELKLGYDKNYEAEYLIARDGGKAEANAEQAVELNASAKAIVKNYYYTSELTIEKTVEAAEGLNPATSSFEFEVAIEGEDTPRKVTVEAGKSVTIADLPVGAEYTVTENDYTEVGFGEVRKTGDSGKIALEASDNKAEFVNVYTVEPVSVAVNVRKAGFDSFWELGSLKNQTFEFCIEGSKICKTVNNVNKTATFEFEYTEPTRETFVITENETGFATGVARKEADEDITVAITVTDDGFGKLVAEVATAKGNTVYDEGETAEIYNDFIMSESDEVVVNIRKEINNISGDAVDGTFRFVVVDELGNMIATEEDAEESCLITTENLSGETELMSISFAEAGEYTFKAFELNDELFGFEYDISEHEIKFVVTEDYENAKYVVAVYVDGEEGDTLTITNNFNIPGQGEIEEENPYTFDEGVVEYYLILMMAILGMFGAVFIKKQGKSAKLGQVLSAEQTSEKYAKIRGYEQKFQRQQTKQNHTR